MGKFREKPGKEAVGGMVVTAAGAAFIIAGMLTAEAQTAKPLPEVPAVPSEEGTPALPGTEQGAPLGTDTETPDVGKDAPLGETLGKTDGVLKPPVGMDPEIHKPAPHPDPDPANKSVIPPPGSPGGDQSVRPK